MANSLMGTRRSRASEVGTSPTGPFPLFGVAVAYMRAGWSNVTVPFADRRTMGTLRGLSTRSLFGRLWNHSVRISNVVLFTLPAVRRPALVDVVLLLTQ